MTSRNEAESVEVQGKHGIVDTEYYAFVDALRGIAILMVVLVHSSAYAPRVDGHVATFIASGARGVQLFFVISAFTLFSTSLQRFPKEPKPRRSFYLRRAFRILPLWWLACLLYFVIGPNEYSEPGPGQPLVDLILHGSFLYGFSPKSMNSLVPGGWSLFCEETFYLLLPLLYSRVGSLIAAVRLALVLLGVSVSWYLFGHFVAQRVSGVTSGYVFMFPFSQWYVFAEGILLFFVLKLPTARQLDRPVALLVDCATVILLWVALVGDAPGPPYSAAVAFFLLFFAMAQPKSLLRMALDNVILRSFGQCCYSIYLFHFWLLHLSAPHVRKLLELLGVTRTIATAQLAWTFSIFAVICLAFGICSFRLIEKPLVALGRRVVHRVNLTSAARRPQAS